MFKSHEKFHATNGKRQILIVDDESVNRELLGHILEEDYELLYAGDGLETLELMQPVQEQTETGEELDEDEDLGMSMGYG